MERMSPLRKEDESQMRRRELRGWETGELSSTWLSGDARYFIHPPRSPNQSRCQYEQTVGLEIPAKTIRKVSPSALICPWWPRWRLGDNTLHMAGLSGDLAFWCSQVLLFVQFRPESLGNAYGLAKRRGLAGSCRQSARIKFGIKSRRIGRPICQIFFENPPPDLACSHFTLSQKILPGTIGAYHVWAVYGHVSGGVESDQHFLFTRARSTKHGQHLEFIDSISGVIASNYQPIQLPVNDPLLMILLSSAKT